MNLSRAYRYLETDPVPFRAAAVLGSEDDAHAWAEGLATIRGAAGWRLEVRRDKAWCPVREIAPRTVSPLVRLLTAPTS